MSFAFLDKEGRLIGWGRLPGHVELPPLATDARLVAIDAPLGLPMGWGCLDLPCTCGTCTAPPSARRAAEVALGNMGIGLFWTTKRSILRPLIEWAIRQRKVLEGLGKEVVEVYPYASKMILWGRPPARKSTVLARRWLQENLASVVADVPRERLLSHDELDALVAAYSGLLWARGQAQALGLPHEGVIVVPKPPIEEGYGL